MFGSMKTLGGDKLRVGMWFFLCSPLHIVLVCVLSPSCLIFTSARESRAVFCSWICSSFTCPRTRMQYLASRNESAMKWSPARGVVAGYRPRAANGSPGSDGI